MYENKILSLIKNIYKCSLNKKDPPLLEAKTTSLMQPQISCIISNNTFICFKLCTATKKVYG